MANFILSTQLPDVPEQVQSIDQWHEDIGRETKDLFPVSWCQHHRTPPRGPVSVTRQVRAVLAALADWCM